MMGLLISGAIALILWLSINSGVTAWHISRASGVVAYLLLSSATTWGLALSTKIVREYAPQPLALELHRSLSWLSIAFTSVHAGALLFDSYYSYQLIDLLVPFMGPYRPGWVGLGTVSLYITFLVSASFSIRKRISTQRWRQLHYLSFPLYLFATLHGLMAGSDSGLSMIQAMYLSSTMLVLFLTNYRIFAAIKPARE